MIQFVPFLRWLSDLLERLERWPPTFGDKKGHFESAGEVFFLKVSLKLGLLVIIKSEFFGMNFCGIFFRMCVGIFDFHLEILGINFAKSGTSPDENIHFCPLKYAVTWRPCSFPFEMVPFF